MSPSYGDDEQRRSVPARRDLGVAVIYERLLSRRIYTISLQDAVNGMSWVSSWAKQMSGYLTP
ncbi:hypothetical protein SAMN05421690_105213 [Nitrosomonas sp. Nm51]|uniref:hypothetical protein n=1 Tax=Nitrosomonas sp. Nm51 TaxID=133720 RepID=UPI0008C94DB9|nr:hypothetical protein [Nitrosomonas sp. Nm51]SER67814.1 hypothetical protein SAMN05421690_105213 [Nitrosomonas sp. Nm51]